MCEYALFCIYWPTYHTIAFTNYQPHDKRHSGSDWFDWIIHWDGASVGPTPHVLRIRRRALITSMLLATCFMDRREGCNLGAGNGSAGATGPDRGGGERHPRVAQAVLDGGDACYVRFMSRVRSALGQFHGSVRSVLGPR